MAATSSEARVKSGFGCTIYEQGVGGGGGGGAVGVRMPGPLNRSAHIHCVWSPQVCPGDALSAAQRLLVAVKRDAATLFLAKPPTY